MDLLKVEDRHDALYPVDRLDRDTEGLLLVTDIGALDYQLVMPHNKVTKSYEAVINEVVTEADVLAFSEGIVFIGGVVCQPAKLNILSTENGNSRVRLKIKEDKFH